MFRYNKHGKVISNRVKRKKSNVGQAFRDTASSLWKVKSLIGDYLRRKKAKNEGK